MHRNTTLYSIAGTDTFRLASKALLKSPWFEGWGTNLQNIEKGMRKIYIPDDGYVFCQCDQSGAEALIVAYLCREGQFRKLFVNRVKPYVFVAIHLFKKAWQQKMKGSGLDIKFDIDEIISTPIEDLQKHPYWKELDTLIKSSDNWPAKERYYYMAKQLCHSSNYGIKSGMFALNTLEKSRGKIVITKKQADGFLSLYHSLFPEIHEWHRDTQRQIEQTKTLYTLQGFPKYFQFSRNIEENDLKACYAFVPQATVACITRKAFCDLQEFIELNNLDWDILADTHDSYLIQCPESESNECCKMLKTFMEQELISPAGIKFRMKSEVACGHNWAPFSDKNPEGLKEVKL